MFDVYYLALVAPALLLSAAAHIFVKYTFAKYSRVRCSHNLTGRDVAALLMKVNRIHDVGIQAAPGALTDHYDPSAKALRLSQPVFSRNSIAALGVAAHETGHAIQHAVSYAPLVLRTALVPVANIGSAAGPWLAIVGILLSFPLLLSLGVFFFSASVLFYLITLPVEFNASARAITLLREHHVLNEAELDGVKQVLIAAALTYVAAALTALMNLVRLILLSRERRG
jgi:Zn-dependent membrane protease YugP